MDYLLFSNIDYHSFGDFLSWSISVVPEILAFVFITNLIFSVVDEIFKRQRRG